jgi:NhaA family Na+:H+ antiporter
MSTALIGCWLLRQRRVTNAWPYVVIGGLLSWAALARGGLHPALALVPVIPFVPHAARDHGLFEESDRPVHDALTRFEHQVRVPVQAVLLFFGLSNAGVPLASVGIGTWIVLVALVVGKPLGISIVSALASGAGARLPSGVTWRDVIVLGAIAGIGFTVALFFCTAAFDEGALLDQTKIGALLSFAAVPVAVGAALVLRVGRFARR